jgi:hypothetical protein
MSAFFPIRVQKNKRAARVLVHVNSLSFGNVLQPNGPETERQLCCREQMLADAYDD